MKKLLVMFALAFAAAQAAGPSYTAHRTTASKASLLAADQASWKPAQVITWGPAPYQTSFRALWNETGLYVRFDSDDTNPWSTMTKRDDHLWEEEVVEIFLDITGKGYDYAEFEVNPANVICDVRMARPAPNPSSDLTWNMENLESNVIRNEKGWVALLYLPWDGFKTLPGVTASHVPPKPGKAWRFNVFRIKRPNGPKDPETGAIFAAWSPTGQRSFHVPAAFREFVFRP
jgi:Domain of unknown function (DUF1083).